MKNKPDEKATLGDVARSAGVSRAAASYALRNLPGVSEETRERVQRIATRMNYTPDARIASWMARVRDAKEPESVPLAWLNTGYSVDVWQKREYLAPYLEGARERCNELGYRLDEFWLREPGMDAERISKILFNRGIRGVIVTPPDRFSHLHLPFRWEWFASASFEKAIVSPQLIQVAQDRYFNMMLCLKQARRLGFHRIAILFEQQSDRRAYHSTQAAAVYFSALRSKAQCLPFLYSGPTGIPKGFAGWLKRYLPDVIICQNKAVLSAVEAAGFNVPEQISVIHTSVDGDCEDWAGIWSRKRDIGRATAETVISLVQNHQYGLPAIARDVLIRGHWTQGRTLIRSSNLRRASISSESRRT